MSTGIAGQDHAVHAQAVEDIAVFVYPDHLDIGIGKVLNRIKPAVAIPIEILASSCKHADGDYD